MLAEIIILQIIFFSVFVGHIYLVYLISLISFFLVFMYMVSTGVLKWNKPILFSFLFFAWVVVVNFYYGIYEISILGKYSIIFTLIFLMLHFGSLSLVNKIQKIILLSSCFAASVIIFNFLTGNTYLGGDRYSIGDYINANYVAYTLVMSVAILYIYRFIFSEKFTKSDLFCVFIIFVGISLTGSRGAIISFLAISTFYVIKKYFSNILHGFFLSIGILIASFLVFLFIPKDIFDRLLFKNSPTTMDYTSGRSDQWPEAVRLINNNPWIGNGADAFTRLNHIYVSDETTLQLHNVFLAIVVEFGFIGLSLYILTLFFIMKRFFNLGLYKGGFIMLIFIGYWLPIALTGIWAYTIPAWVFFSWLMVLGCVYKENGHS